MLYFPQKVGKTSKKLSLFWKRPYEITKKFNVNLYQVKESTEMKRLNININLMKSYVKRGELPPFKSLKSEEKKNNSSSTKEKSDEKKIDPPSKDLNLKEKILFEGEYKVKEIFRKMIIKSLNGKMKTHYL